MKGIRIDRDCDFGEFLKVLKRQGKPTYLPFYEHVASSVFISNRMEIDISKLNGKAYWRCYVDFWYSLGFDCIPMEIPLNVKLPTPRHIVRSEGAVSHGSEAGACVFSLEDLKKVEWPPEDAPIDFTPFEIVAEILPPDVKIVGGVCGGPFEFATQSLLGLEGLAFALVDQPELVDAIFDRLNILYTSANRRLATMDAIGACRQGDDLGFKTSTFLSLSILRKYIFPIYRNMVDAAHKNNKPFILHSCGNLKEIYEDIIQCGIDAKHSFEDTIMSERDFKHQYGEYITPLGGLDVDFICRSGEKELREYTRRTISECFYDGFWALGTGNSLTPYMPIENYLCVLDEGLETVNP